MTIFDDGDKLPKFINLSLVSRTPSSHSRTSQLESSRKPVLAHWMQTAVDPGRPHYETRRDPSWAILRDYLRPH